MRAKPAITRQWLLLVGVVLAPSAGAAPHAGKVVRIEREPHGPIGKPRMCNVAADGKGYCIGPKPQVGDRITVVDTARVLGEVRVSASDEFGGCGQGTVWQVAGKVELGDLSRPAQGEMVGVIDVQIDRRVGHRVSVDRPTGSTAPADQIWGIDSNGDGTIDVEFTEYQCDDQGVALSSASGMCVDVWARTSHGFDRIRQDRIRNCT